MRQRDKKIAFWHFEYEFNLRQTVPVHSWSFSSCTQGFCLRVFFFSTQSTGLQKLDYRVRLKIMGSLKCKLQTQYVKTLVVCISDYFRAKNYSLLPDVVMLPVVM